MYKNVAVKPEKLFYHYDTDKYHFLQEKIKQPEEFSEKAASYISCDPSFINLFYFRDFIPDKPGSEEFSYGNFWQYTQGKKMACRACKKYSKLEEDLKKKTFYMKERIHLSIK